MSNVVRFPTQPDNPEIELDEPAKIPRIYALLGLIIVGCIVALWFLL